MAGQSFQSGQTLGQFFEPLYVAFNSFISGSKTLCRFVNQSTCFIPAYCQGLSSAQAAWANKKYHGHHILLPDMIALVKETIPN
jgi:hypothetical protein